MPPSIAVSNFAQELYTPAGNQSHFEGSWEELLLLVQVQFVFAIPGYRDGVLRVPVPPERFFSSSVQVHTDTELRAVFEPRRVGEEPFLQVLALSEKRPALGVEIILYRHDVLKETEESSSEAEWEVVSIQARSSEEEEPMHPVTMARNYLQRPGGTKGEYAAEEFAKSIWYWSTRAKAVGSTKL